MVWFLYDNGPRHERVKMKSISAFHETTKVADFRWKSENSWVCHGIYIYSGFTLDCTLTTVSSFIIVEYVSQILGKRGRRKHYNMTPRSRFYVTG